MVWKIVAEEQVILRNQLCLTKNPPSLPTHLFFKVNIVVKELLPKQLITKGAHFRDLDGTLLPAGLYFMAIQTDRESVVKKLVVK